jgi:hypothetical protein
MFQKIRAALLRSFTRCVIGWSFRMFSEIHSSFGGDANSNTIQTRRQA